MPVDDLLRQLRRHDDLRVCIGGDLRVVGNVETWGLETWGQSAKRGKRGGNVGTVRVFPNFVCEKFSSEPHYIGMPRMPRAVLSGVAHHLTQRGVDRQDVFFTDAQREAYISLVAHGARQFGVQVLPYCLMTNHVHWVVVPEGARSLARAFGWAHGRYAQHVNAARLRSGHLWQNRFFSCALDEGHTWAAVRHVEQNPVRAGLVERAGQWRWSSAAARAGAAAPEWLDLSWWRERFTPEQWEAVLRSRTMGEAETRLRANTYTGRPAGSVDFVAYMESTLERRLQPSKGGRPSRQSSGEQASLFAGGAG